MSLRRSTSGGEHLQSLSRNGERTPLRSLQTENLIDSPKSLSIKSELRPNTHLKGNSLICALKNDPACDEPIEYNFWKLDDVSVPEGALSPKDNRSNESERLEEDLSINCADVTLKSYHCNGGEVEISDEVEAANETIPLPLSEMGEDPHAEALDSSNAFESTGFCHTTEATADHAYCSRVRGMSSDTITTALPLSEPGDALGDITIKYLNCSGGEIEITDSVHMVDRTIPLPTESREDLVKSCIDDADSHIFTDEYAAGHADHPYCNTLGVNGAHVMNQQSMCGRLNEAEQSNTKLGYREPASSLSPVQETQCSNENISVNGASLLLEELHSTLFADIVLKKKNDPDEVAISSESTSRSVNAPEHSTKEMLEHKVSDVDSSQHLPDASHGKALSILQEDAKERDGSSANLGSKDHSSPQSHQDSDSALGLSPSAPISSGAPQTKTIPEVLKAIAEGTPLNLKFLTPIIRRASLACIEAQKELVADLFAGDDCGPGERSVETLNRDAAELWTQHLDSPMSRPLFNSTELMQRSQPCTIAEPPKDVTLSKPDLNKKSVVDIPMICEGPLQQQLRQMAEFLMLASGKIGRSLTSAPEHQNVCVGTSPLRFVNHSINTSGQFERGRSFCVEDQCTSTDPLLWNTPVDSLESVSRPELEQRVLSSMVIVEALVQQLAAARARTLPPAGVVPSELRDRTVQTEHTELSQASLHRDLYLESLNRIKEIELDNTSLQSLALYMQNINVAMTTLMTDSDAAFLQMKQMGEVFREDHSSLLSNYGKMKALLQKSKESQVRMLQKVKDLHQQKDYMDIKMEEAFSAKEAVYSVMEQLRKHSSMEISELEKCLGSQQELLSALEKANPAQVALWQDFSETLNLTSELLSKTTEEQSSLAKELCLSRRLMEKCRTILQKLSTRAGDAFRDRDLHIAERDRAFQDKERMEEERDQALQNLHAAKGQIGDLNLQVTILTSEMGVLRQKLSENEEARDRLDRKATELSATVSSTLASYAFLEQALASETNKLQQSWADIKQARERAQDLELTLGQSEQRVGELSEALVHSQEQVLQLQSVSETQALEVRRLQDMCSQLSGVRDMNEFLQMEYDLSREQMAESERMLRVNLQSLRERNIQCEDLNRELHQLQHENKNLREELDCVRTELNAGQMEHKDKLEQIVTEVAILHHTVRSLTTEVQASLKEENPEHLGRTVPSALVDNVTVAQTPATEQSPIKGPSDASVQSEVVFSAFRRITAVTPKRSLSAERDAEEQSNNITEQLVGLDSIISELRNALTTALQHKDALLKDRQHAICCLQRELEDAHSSHQTEVSELQYQNSRLTARMEKINVTLQQKTQDEKTVSNLVAEISDIQDMLNKHKAESNELRKEVVELRRCLQRSKSEAHFLRDELRKTDGHSAPPADYMEEKIALLKEMERLKMSLQDEEQARMKLLDRAKRHQAIYETNQQKSEKELQMLNNILNKIRETLLSLPETVKNCEQLQQLMEYVG